VIHHLEQDVEEIAVGLLDLVEQQNGVGLLAHPFHQLAPLVVSDVSGRGADQPRDRVLLHVLAHVEAQEGNAQ